MHEPEPALRHPKLQVSCNLLQRSACERPSVAQGARHGCLVAYLLACRLWCEACARIHKETESMTVGSALCNCC